MKKKIALGLTGVMMLSALTGCGKFSSKYLLDVDYSDYVKLCEYKGLEGEKVKVEITDEEIQEEVDYRMYDYATTDVVTDRGIEIGDCANIDYAATMDGAEAEEYSGEDEELYVGEGYYYPELEDALVGMKTGESKDVEVELTEEYAEEEDVGTKISLNVKVNEISVDNIPEYNEEFVKENTDYDSIEDYEASIKEELKESKEETYKYEVIDTMMIYMMDNSKFDGYPEELYTQCEENYDSSNEYMAAMYGMELEDYLDLMGIDDATRKEEIEYSVNYELVIGAIAQKEKIDSDKDEINKFVKDTYEEYGYESEDEFLADYTEEEIGCELIYEKVIEFLYDNAELKEVSEEEYQEAHPEDEYYEEEDSEDEATESSEVEDAESEEETTASETTDVENAEEDVTSEEETTENSETSETYNSEESNTSEETTTEQE